ncbi:MAG TPA: hypothetical protein VK463_14505 [Desulfomonilaceae bacterium]|nr:hypothetical protein [Desulfomonilaceae bacterium]
MSAADSWAVYKKRCEQDPNYGRRKRDEWSEASRTRQKMEKWGCYNCPFLENITSGSGDLTDGCKAVEDKGAEVKRLQTCPNPKKKKRITEDKEEPMDN